MISVSTNLIPLTFTRQDFHQKFNSVPFLQKLFDGGNIKPLHETDTVKFLLKRVAIFEMDIDKEADENWVQLISTKAMNFQTAIRFELEEDKGIYIHVETDTNVFMELFLEKRIKKMVESIVNSLKRQAY